MRIENGESEIPLVLMLFYLFHELEVRNFPYLHKISIEENKYFGKFMIDSLLLIKLPKIVLES